MENFNGKGYEEKLRIEYKVKKEFREKNMDEWTGAGCAGILAIFAFIFIAALFKACIS